ncbi:MAG: ATP-binding protein [Phaeospirillum sp.]|nr:ATP-binding protein [Phaeospirillum sp.]
MMNISVPHQPMATVTMLVGDGVISEDLAGQCAALGLRVALLPDGRCDGADGCILAGASSAGLVRRGMTPPFSGFVELGDEGVLGVGLRCFETVRAGGLCLSLLTGQAYALNTMELLSEGIRHSMNLPAGKVADQIDICMGEAIGNAVIHGNLGIPNHLRATSKGFEHFRHVLHERLADPVLSRRRVEVNVMARGADFLTITVSDQGHGFDLAGKLSRDVQSDAKSGRGLGLIRKICASVLGEDEGRTLVMTFAR